MANTQSKHLVFSGKTWYIKMRIPSDLVEYYGKKTINKSTRTDSFKEAEKQLQAQLYEFDLARAKVTGNGKEQYEQHLAYLMNMIDEAKRDGNEDVINAPELDGDESTPEPIAKAIADANKYLSDGSLKNAQHYNDTYAISLKEALALEEKRINRRNKDTGLYKKRVTAVKMFLEYLGTEDIRLVDISRKDANGFVDSRVDAEKSHKTVRNYMAGLKACWEAASRFEHVEAHLNPFDGIAVIETGANSYEPFTREQLKALLEETTSPDHAFHHVLRIGIVTGARLAEIVSLKKSDIVEIDNVICMNVREGKTINSERIVPLRAGVGDAIKKLSESSGNYLFPHLVGKTVSSVSNQFARLKRAAGVDGKGYVFHSLRHNIATALERVNVPQYQMNRILGHKTSDMSTGTYSKGLPVQEVAKQIDTALMQPEYPSDLLR